MHRNTCLFPQVHAAPRLRAGCFALALALCLVAFDALAADRGSRQHARGEYDSSAATYVVAEGDDLIEIARRFETTVEKVQ